MKNKAKSPFLNIGDRFISKVNENEYAIVAIDTSVGMYAYVNVRHLNDPLWINWSEFTDIEDKKQHVHIKLPECGTKSEMDQYVNYVRTLKPLSFKEWKKIKK